MAQGKLIVLYGINNLGKSTQAKKLVERLEQHQQPAVYLKYPNYDQEPFGPIINNYLRQGNRFNFTAREFQLLHLLDKLNYQPQLEQQLAQGIHVIAEDYKGTSIAWGMGAGVDQDLLKTINQVLRAEDLVFLFDGQRFRQAVETGHKHETDDELTEKVRQAHLQLGQEYGWQLIKANQPIDRIHEQLWAQVSKIL